MNAMLPVIEVMFITLRLITLLPPCRDLSNNQIETVHQDAFKGYGKANIM